MEENKKEQPVVYKEERFEFALYVNNNIICKRNFSINDFIEHSMESVEFKYKIDEIVSLIQDDLKAKSSIYTWYYFNPMEPEVFDEMTPPPLAPWECTFRFEVMDRKKVVISKIWDGYAYPKAVRDRVDLGNKTVKIFNKNGMVYTYDKETFFKDRDDDKLSFELRVLKAMIWDRQDLLIKIIKQICETCSVHEDLFSSVSDYTFNESWGKDANGKEVRYNFNIDAHNRKIERKWLKLYLDKKNKIKKN